RRQARARLAKDDVPIAAVLKVIQAFLILEHHLKSFVGLDAPFVGVLTVREAVNVLTTGPPVAGRRELERTDPIARFLQVDDVLHAALAVAPLADNDGPFVILQ